MILLKDSFPLLIGITPQRIDARAVEAMAAAFEPLFVAGRKYAFVSVQRPDTALPSAKERKLILDWADSPRVREYAAQLCVAAATVVDNSLYRGALTAMLWIWKPPFPMKPVATTEQGIEHCLDGLEQRGVPLWGATREELRARATGQLEATLARSAQEAVG